MTVKDNSAQSGGGFYIDDSTMEMEGRTFSIIQQIQKEEQSILVTVKWNLEAKICCQHSWK